MAHTLSALKRLRQGKKHAARNRAARSTIKTQAKKVIALASAKKPDEARKELSRAYQLIDRAVRRGILHANAGRRRKSRLASLVGAR